MSLKWKVLVIAAAALGWAACAQNNLNRAPVCPYGQALAYTTSGYACNLVSLSTTGINAQQIQSGPPMPGSLLTPPVQSCGAAGNQTLIDWMGTWVCYYSQTIWPNNGNSPQSLTPPTQTGGEFCTSVGIPPQAAAFGNSMLTSLYVGCSPGFSCIATPGTSSTAYGAYGIGFNGGQAGACQLTGYNGI